MKRLLLLTVLLLLPTVHAMTCTPNVQPKDYLICTVDLNNSQTWSFYILYRNKTQLANGTTTIIGGGSQAIIWQVPEGLERDKYIVIVDYNGSYISSTFEIGRKFDISKDLRGDIMAMPILAFFVFMVGFFIVAQWKNDVILQVVAGIFALGLAFHLAREQPFPTDLMNKIAYMMMFVVGIYFVIILPTYMMQTNVRKSKGGK